MSLTLNMVGGGGGGLAATDALLRVQAPAQSTVTITKGAVTKSDAGHENADDHTVYDYYFIIHQSQFDSVNAWTVTATDGTDTATDTVIIDAADEYDVALNYYFWLYKDGVMETTVSGGLTAAATGGTGGTITFNADNITITGQGNSSSGPNRTVCTVNTMDLTNYSKIVAEFTSSKDGFMGATTNRSTPYSWGVRTAQNTTTGTAVTVEADCSSATTGWYVGFGYNGAANAASYITLTKLYLVP